MGTGWNVEEVKESQGGRSTEDKIGIGWKSGWDQKRKSLDFLNLWNNRVIEEGFIWNNRVMQRKGNEKGFSYQS